MPSERDAPSSPGASRFSLGENSGEGSDDGTQPPKRVVRKVSGGANRYSVGRVRSATVGSSAAKPPDPQKLMASPLATKTPTRPNAMEINSIQPTESLSLGTVTCVHPTQVLSQTPTLPLEIPSHPPLQITDEKTPLPEPPPAPETPKTPTITEKEKDAGEKKTPLLSRLVRPRSQTIGTKTAPTPPPVSILNGPPPMSSSSNSSGGGGVGYEGTAQIPSSPSVQNVVAAEISPSGSKGMSISLSPIARRIRAHTASSRAPPPVTIMAIPNPEDFKRAGMEEKQLGDLTAEEEGLLVQISMLELLDGMAIHFKLPKAKKGKPKEKADDDRPPGLIFGQYLETVLDNEQSIYGLPERPTIPVMIERCTAYFYNDKEAISQPGIFRLSGSLKKGKEFQEALDAGQPATFDKVGAHEIASTMKAFFRFMPEPLLTTRLYPVFIKTTSYKHVPHLHASLLQRAVSLLPKSNRLLLQHLIDFIHYVTLFEVIEDALPTIDSAPTTTTTPPHPPTPSSPTSPPETPTNDTQTSTNAEVKKWTEEEAKKGNRMGLRNMSVMFGPNILRTTKGKQKGTTLDLEECEQVADVLEALVRHRKIVFTVPGATMEKIHSRLQGKG